MMSRFSPLAVLLVLLNVAILISAHQNPSFPGSQGDASSQQPPLSHEQQQAHQQFGGDQAKDAEHIKEHLEGKVNPTANMTPEQLQFHYFNMHDLNKDGKLDGIELIKAITHFHQENPGPQHKDTGVPPPLPSEIELEHMVDSILQEDDFDGDGYVDYGEFLMAQRQREEQSRNQQRQQPPPPPPK